MRIDLSCSKCGSKFFEYDSEIEFMELSEIKCVDCGYISQNSELDEIKQEVIDLGIKKVMNELKF